MASTASGRPIGKPFQLRDFSKGRISKSSVNAYLAPQNSVANSTNVNFDTVIGSGVVRPGSTLVGAQVAANKTPLGLYEFVGAGGSPNLQLSVFTGASTASLYYFDTAWHTSGLTSLSNSAKVRFTTLGGHAFMANGVDVMKDSVDGNTWATTNSAFSGDSVIPSLLFRAKQRMLAGGWSTYPDRVYFSSIINPTTSPFITWNSNATTGDWIDINPEDGGYITGFSETSNQTLVFKNNGMYRLDVVNKNVDSQNIFNIGAVSQEAITQCQGLVYFFSGIDIRRTDGTYPVQISRLGVQDYIDAIPQANWSSVSSGNDGWSVFFSIGTVTLNQNRNSQVTYTNVVLKFSTRDETWSVHSTGQKQSLYSNLTSSTNGRKMTFADTTGSVQAFGVGTTDNGTPINFELETQELDLGNRSHTDKMSDLIAVFTNNGIDSRIAFKENDGDWRDIPGNLDKRINILDGFSIESNYVAFRWSGVSSGHAPVFEGLYIEDVVENPLTK